MQTEAVDDVVCDLEYDGEPVKDGEPDCDREPDVEPEVLEVFVPPRNLVTMKELSPVVSLVT